MTFRFAFMLLVLASPAMADGASVSNVSPSNSQAALSGNDVGPSRTTCQSIAVNASHCATFYGRSSNLPVNQNRPVGNIGNGNAIQLPR